MPYKIKQYTYDQANKLNVEIMPAKNPKKKIDVYKNGINIASVGASGYSDYPTYLQQNPKQAEAKRKAYKARHEKDRHKQGSNGFYADKLLW